MSISSVDANKYPKSIPVAYDLTLEEATHLRIFFCKLSYDDRYMWPRFDGTLEGPDGLVAVGRKLDAEVERWRNK
jgi:hypothetical protein